MNKQLIATIKELEINKAPEEQTLELANQSYTKKQLAHFIERFDLDIAKSWKKDEIVAPLSDWMKEASVDLLNSDTELRSFYMEKVLNAEEPLDVYSNDLSEADLERVLLLMEHGMAYNVDGQLWTPDETISAVSKDVESDDQSVSSEEPTPQEKAKEITSQPELIKKKPTQTTSPSLSKEEKLAQNKQIRLKYLKKQAKKKK
ncbi:hypothetical protein ACO1PF_10180 [Alkalibacterium sp. f15]|uniref:hypothetical protein n=1 Tax=Alkalibacterium sp. f15 TaxID=3414029 RepID=UPI003BF89AEB